MQKSSEILPALHESTKIVFELPLKYCSKAALSQAVGKGTPLDRPRRQTKSLPWTSTVAYKGSACSQSISSLYSSSESVLAQQVASPQMSPHKLSFNIGFWIQRLQGKLLMINRTVRKLWVCLNSGKRAGPRSSHVTKTMRTRLTRLD